MPNVVVDNVPKLHLYYYLPGTGYRSAKDRYLPLKRCKGAKLSSNIP
jgi:hypothetical protein